MPRLKAETLTQTVTPEIVGYNERFEQHSPTDSFIEPDEFASPEFLDPNGKLPRLQALRGMSPDLCGYFINIDEMAKAGWLDFDSVADQMTEYTYESSGNVEQGMLMKQPRMLVCPRTPLLSFDRKASKEAEQLVGLGHWKREYKEDDNVGNCQMYEIILLSDRNQPLHSLPFSYVAKGANQATFSQEWQKLVQEVTNCHAITNSIAARPKDARFRSLCVFVPMAQRELVGKKQKSPACRIASHLVPTIENWTDFFVGYNSELKKLVWEGLQPTLPLLMPGVTTETLALPASPEE